LCRRYPGLGPGVRAAVGGRVRSGGCRGPCLALGPRVLVPSQWVVLVCRAFDQLVRPAPALGLIAEAAAAVGLPLRHVGTSHRWPARLCSCTAALVSYFQACAHVADRSAVQALDCGAISDFWLRPTGGIRARLPAIVLITRFERFLPENFLVFSNCSCCLSR